jgi:phage FluMu protein Com
MIRFQCEHCGQKFSVPQTTAGKKGRCPKCKSIITIPAVAEAKPDINKTESGTANLTSKDLVLDPNIFDIPQENKVVGHIDAQEDESDKALKNLRKLQAGKAEPEPPPERNLPWFIDVDLYPTSTAGLTMMGIFVGVPLLMDIFVWLLFRAALSFHPFLVFAVFFSYISIVINIIILLYMYWYFCECIRDSAKGGIRSPETMTATGELGQVFRALVTWMVFWLPPVLYSLIRYSPFRVLGAVFTTPGSESVMGLYLHVIKNDIVFSLLWLYAIYFFPMALLSVVLFDSLNGLNPLIILPSILRTPFQYSIVVIVFCTPIIALFEMLALRMYLQNAAFRFGLLGLLLQFVWVWQLLIVGHLTGRYYYRNEKKLYWDV